MKSYLSLIPVSAKVHRRQNRLTLLCIVFAVFMVTAVFSMAEIGIRMEYAHLVGKHGSWSVRELLCSSAGQMVLPVAVLLGVLILISSIFMIASSMNSRVTQRTQFFGMMRCIGMSKEQVRRFVRLEALNWCKTAVPVGLALGIGITWILCAVLHFLVGEEFVNIPLFGISIPGIFCGILVGVISVLFAANAPARRAARVSPVAAVSAADSGNIRWHAMQGRSGKIETRLGIHHAVSLKKNLILMTCSFALSIILFLSFSVIVNLVDYLMPQSVAASDIDISDYDGSNTIPPELSASVRKMNEVKEVYGRRSKLDVPAVFSGDGSTSGTVDLISYDDFDLESLKKDGNLKKGSHLSEVYGDSHYVLATSDETSTWKIGDTISIGNETLTIAGLLKNDPFQENGLTNGKMTLITSGETFVRLTGEDDYALIMIQMTGKATDDDVQSIRSVAGDNYRFEDNRESQTSGTYFAFIFCAYAFLAIIALVTVLNIVNSISMSVSARMKQYGAMRAVGMDEQQITKMIAFEALTYAFTGCLAGCLIGLPLQKELYELLITAHFPYAIWHFPVTALLIILTFVFLAAVVAVYVPAKRICNMPVTATINEL